jgi:subtilase family serine protease
MLKRIFVFFLIALAGTTPATSNVMVALNQRNTDTLLEAFHNVSDPTSQQYGHYWSQADIDHLVSPPQSQIEDLKNYYKSKGVDCVQKGGAALLCDERVSQCNNHILVDFIEHSAHADMFAAYTPRSNPKSVGAGDGYVGREVLLKLYNITHSRVENPEISVCAVEYQNVGGISNQDLETQQSLNGEVKKDITHIKGTNQSPMLEAQLDVQMMSQVAENADVWMWSGTQWLYSFAVDFLNTTDIPDVLSMSWGWSARDQCSSGLGTCPGNMTSSQYLHRVNMEYVKMGLRGVTVAVSSGDAGAPGRTNENCAVGDGTAPVNPAFPGSSPYITSVSATYIVPTATRAPDSSPWTTPICQNYGCVNGTQELPCNYAVTGWTTGGGFAVYDETRPSWQNTAVENYLATNAKRPKNFTQSGRGYPDVAAVGHNCPTVTSGSLMGVDGTSCSSPIFASVVALLNDYQTAQGKPKLGFANPVLYKMWSDNKNIFHDISEGNNWCTEIQCCDSDFGYESAKGWDPVTGLGTPNVGLMTDWLDANTVSVN